MSSCAVAVASSCCCCCLPHVCLPLLCPPPAGRTPVWCGACRAAAASNEALLRLLLCAHCAGHVPTPRPLARTCPTSCTPSDASFHPPTCTNPHPLGCIAPAPPLGPSPRWLPSLADLLMYAGCSPSSHCSYVYLPPGSSMRDPVSLPNSMSDPLERRVRHFHHSSIVVCALHAKRRLVGVPLEGTRWSAGRGSC